MQKNGIYPSANGSSQPSSEEGQLLLPPLDTRTPTERERDNLRAQLEKRFYEQQLNPPEPEPYDITPEEGAQELYEQYSTMAVHHRKRWRQYKDKRKRAANRLIVLGGIAAALVQLPIGGEWGWWVRAALLVAAALLGLVLPLWQFQQIRRERKKRFPRNYY